MRITGIVVAAALLFTACGGSDETTTSTSVTTSTLAEFGDVRDLFEEVAVGDQDAGNSADQSSDDETTDPVVTEPDTGGTGSDPGNADVPSDTVADEGDVPGTTPGSGTTGGDTSDDAVCAGVQRVDDGYDRIDAADSLDDTEARAAFEETITALRSVEAIAPVGVADDAELLAVGIELVISVELDGAVLTADQSEILVGGQLEDAGDRFESFALDVCGIELFTS